MLASALAYSTFFAIPSVLLVVVGVFTLIAGPATITALMGHFSHVMPGQATSLLRSSLKNLDAHPASSLVMTVVGFVLAVWSTTGAMTAYMTAINLAYNRKDRRKRTDKARRPTSPSPRRAPARACSAFRRARAASESPR